MKPVAPSDSVPSKNEEKKEPSVELVHFAPVFAVEGTEGPSQSDAEILRRRWISRWLMVLLVIGVLAYLMNFGPIFYRDIKVWRASVLARQGEEFVRQNRIEEAVPMIRAGFALSPNAPEVLRAMAQIMTNLKIPNAMTYWNWLLKTDEATDDDRRTVVDCAMENGLYSEADDLIQTLLTHDKNDSRNLLLAARLSSERGTPAETMAYATRAALNDPGNREAALFLAQLEIDNKGLHQKGIDSLFQLAEGNDNFGLRALDSLAGDPNLTTDEIDRLIARLKSHPLSDEAQRLTALTFEIARHPAQHSKLLDEAIAAHQDVKPADQAAFSEWLINHGEAQRVFTLISRERALSDKDAFSAYVDAMGALQKWADLKVLLSSARVPLEAYMVELYLSRCATELGDTEGSDLHWRNAVLTANFNATQSLYLALYAEKLGRNDRAAEVYRALTQEPVVAHFAYLGLLRVESGNETKTQALRDLLDEIVYRWPDDPAIMTQDIYFNLLLNERVSEMRQRTLELIKQDPKNLGHRTNLALACLRLHDPAGAFAAYGSATVDWNNVADTDRSIYAATLFANGDSRNARQLLLLVNRKALRPELQELIKPIH